MMFPFITSIHFTIDWLCIYFNHHLCLDNKYEKFWESSENISFLSIWGTTTSTKFQFCAACVCERACVRFVFLFLDVFSFGRIEFFFTFVLFAFDDTDSYRIYVDLFLASVFKTEVRRAKDSHKLIDEIIIHYEI